MVVMLNMKINARKAKAITELAFQAVKDKDEEMTDGQSMETAN